MDQPKIERMLRLMKMMSGNINYSVEELSEKLEMSDRTIYRYIDTFKNAGFTVTKIWANTYKLEKMPKSAPEFDKLMYFSEEESYLINSLLDALVPTNALKKGIKDKLAVICDATSVPGLIALQQYLLLLPGSLGEIRDSSRIAPAVNIVGNGSRITDYGQLVLDALLERIRRHQRIQQRVDEIRLLLGEIH